MKLLKKAILLLSVILLCTVFACAEAPDLTAETAVLIDGKTGQVLYDKNMHQQMYPASITKVATVITGLEHLDLSETITMSHYAVYSLPRGSSHISLDEGEEITVEQAVYAALLKSANDACNGIAEASAGSIEAFTVMMNETAKRAGALNTNFINAHGMSEEEHVTTAYDMAMICRYALENEDFRKAFGTYKYIMPPNNKKDEERIFINQHQMISVSEMKYDGIIGGKIGWTTPSKHTLVTAAERDGRCLVAVVLKCPKGGQYEDTAALFDYGFSKFDSVVISGEDLPKNSGYTLEEPITLLVENGIKKENIIFEVSEKDGEGVCTAIYPDGKEITAFACTKIPKPEPLAVNNADENGEESLFARWLSIILKAVLALVIVIAGLFILLVLVIYIRKKIYRAKKKRKRRRR